MELDGPPDADSDLYLDVGDDACPTTSNYDYRSITTNSQESITIDAPDGPAELGILVGTPGEGSTRFWSPRRRKRGEPRP